MTETTGKKGDTSLISKNAYEGFKYESNNCGILEIIDYINYTKVYVRFLDTGYETYAVMGDIKKGKVKDKLYPSVSGVGYTGVGQYKTSVNGKHTDAYKCWKSMIARCYDEKTLEKRPAYRGCSVAEVWHNFQTFAEWYGYHYVEGYHLDKDIKVKGNRVYGPDTCMFVSASDNLEAAHAKSYIIISPSGDIIMVYNLKRFCEENGLIAQDLHKVVIGERKHHKGWTSGK